MIPPVAQVFTARLKALFNGDSNAFDRSPRGFNDFQKAIQGAAVRQKVVDYEHMVFGTDELLGNDDVENLAMGKALDARAIHFAIEVDRLGFLGEHDRSVVEMARGHAGNANPRSLDGEDLVDRAIGEQALELRAHGIEQIDIDSMVQKAIDLQDAFSLHHAIAPDSLFKKLHAKAFPPMRAFARPLSL